MTITLPVRAEARSYDVVIGAGVLESIGRQLVERHVKNTVKVHVITDQNVARLGYAEQVKLACEAAGYNLTVSVVEPGDASKTLDTATGLYDDLLTNGLRRDGIVLAVGGGMVGDLAGFVAATYQRGIRFVQIPTTLLAHDSSIGGKVGVNLPRGKNLVGAFHPPVLVLYDTSLLTSLPEAEWQGGMAELIKHGIIGDPDLFARLEREPLATCPDPVALESILADGCAVKVRIVEEDEREGNRRMLLNLGHTVGHAVEKVSDFGLNHGYAVAIGMSVEAEIAVRREMASADTRDQIRRVLKAHGLPIVPPEYPIEQILRVMGVDKKHGAAGWTFALPRTIGRVDVVSGITPEEVVTAWTATQAMDSDSTV